MVNKIYVPEHDLIIAGQLITDSDNVDWYAYLHDQQTKFIPAKEAGVFTFGENITLTIRKNGIKCVLAGTNTAECLELYRNSNFGLTIG